MYGLSGHQLGCKTDEVCISKLQTHLHSSVLHGAAITQKILHNQLCQTGPAE